MAKFSQISIQRLSTCHPDLQLVLTKAILEFDFSVLAGHRGELEQTIAFQEGKSKTPWPKSKHNGSPSLAVDIAPYPILWPDPKNPKNWARFYYLGGYVLGIAAELNVPLRWGGDWDGDRDIHEQRFDDLPHFELVEL
jgi:peptidoglycan L-alanyl-D-glutamate endopeptidase CwlK